MIHAPFNFVPLPEQIVFPEGADIISQDIPFKNGVSGVIHLSIKAETDVFVRNGHRTGAEDDSFSHIENTYFIPGTTLKGCFRSVLEILSFGKLSQYNKHSFAIRDLNDNTYKKLIQNNPTHAGWLYLDNRIGQFRIADCGEVKKGNRISHKDINQAIKNNVFDVNSFKSRDARKKYEMLGNVLKCNDARMYKEGRKFYIIENKCLVFTGQPNKKKKKEFLFNKFIPNENDAVVSADDMTAFQSIHSSSADYTEFWKQKLMKGHPIPVFFQIVGNHHYIGLSYMFKYPARTNVEGAVQNYFKHVIKTTETCRHDMADVIFGCTDGAGLLRGRVQVGHAFVQGSPIEDKSRKVTLMSSPRPSYFPLYLKSGTWDSVDAEIKGYKRYPVRNSPLKLRDMKYGEKLKNMERTISLLKKGTNFQGDIVFHNLRPVELGALLYAIALRRDTSSDGNAPLYHNIGACKPLGYGKVSMTYKLDVLEGENVDFLAEFADYMEKTTKNGWEKSETVKQLKAMAMGIPAGMENKFEYMVLDSKNKRNDFVDGKKAKERLRSFTDIISSPNVVVLESTKPTGGIEIFMPKDNKGWNQEAGKTYSGLILDNNVLIINYPKYDEGFQKSVRCKVKNSESISMFAPKTKVSIKILELRENSGIMTVEISRKQIMK